jgi:hypothetical protein
LSESLAQVASYLGELAVYLRNPGADVPEPSLERYDTGEIGFAITAALPGSHEPKPAVMTAQEIWNPTGAGRYERAEYAYDLIDYQARSVGDRDSAGDAINPDQTARRDVSGTLTRT